MAFPIPNFSKSQINKAGVILISKNPSYDDLVWAYGMLNFWRACHGYPVNTFQATLRHRLKSIDKNAIVAQRLKRTPSILSKLERNPGMALARMQDIGGLRAVVSNIEQVRKLQSLYADGNLKHELSDVDDYITFPKVSGYRSLHLIYKYINSQAPKYNGLHIELQIRTQLQHAWATAVETIGTFLGQPLKSSEGSEAWLSFFQVAGAAIASLEKSPSVPGFENMTTSEIFHKVTYMSHLLGVVDKLRAFTVATNAITSDRRSGSYHLVVLDSVERTVKITTFGRRRLEEANLAYAEAEKQVKENELIQAVLVATGTIDSLKRAYPNYFLDTAQFLKTLLRIMSLSEKLSKNS